jgi:hypothetical protein
MLLSACSASDGNSTKSLSVYPPPYAGPPAGSPTFPNWPFPPVLLFEDAMKLDEVPLSFVEAKGAGAGTTGVMRVVVDIPGREGSLPLKLKLFPNSLDGWNNSPRKEMAAFAIQQIIFDLEDYVVPTTWPRCLGLAKWNAQFDSRDASIEGTDCVLVALALWLEDVKVTRSNPYQADRFRKDGAYAYYMSNLNLLTYLIDHRDGRKGNFLVSKDKKRPQYFSIDNGIAFNPWIINPLIRNWHRIRVPSVRKTSIDRLRLLDRAGLDYLAVVAQMEPDSEGVLRLVRPGPPREPNAGVSVEDETHTIQIGLTKSEIDKIWSRIQALIARVDEGSLPVF